MAVGFERAFPGASPEQIESVQAALGVELPADYRRFLERHNGGDLEVNSLPPEADASVRHLYSAGRGDNDHVFALDPDYLAIGEDDGGNLICLKLSGGDRGAVYFWTHDAFANTDPFERLAGGFEEFFEGLRPIDELDLDH